ncbi:unnamed protein product [Caenorhabditis sp. 36 PRJEB53466]|nr:unnamed protein product [Caenorhabditis sp. 36 PRJEB53466]
MLIPERKERTDIRGEKGQFKCGTGQCIEENQKCNRKYECADGSDEITCDYYIAVQKYHAEQQKQESAAHAQDAPAAPAAPVSPTAPAPTESAEDPSEVPLCNDQEFRCPYLAETRCFHYDKLCDGVDDCGDGSDETNCDSNEDQDQPAAPIPPPAPAPESVQEAASQCAVLQFECKRDGKCIDKALQCNHKYDCEDGSDETECEYFKAAMARREQSVATTTDQQNRQVHHQTQHQQAQQHHQQQRPQPAHPAQPSQPSHPAQPSHDQHEEHRRRLEEHRRREEEHKRRQEEESRARAHEQSLLHASQVESTEVTFHDEYEGDSGVGCLEHEFQCAIGECIDKRRVCDTRPDCLDASDEQNCADRAPAHHQQQQPHHVAAPSLPPVNNYPEARDTLAAGADLFGNTL